MAHEFVVSLALVPQLTALLVPIVYSISMVIRGYDLHMTLYV